MISMISLLAFLLLTYAAKPNHASSNEKCSKSNTCDDARFPENQFDIVRSLKYLSMKYSTETSDLINLLNLKEQLVSQQPQQTDYLPRRTSDWRALQDLQKFSEERYEISGLKAESIAGKGFGLVTTRKIKNDYQVLSAKAEDVLSTQHSLEQTSCLGDWELKEGKFSGLWRVGNLSLILLAHAYNEKSIFRPYLDALPKEYAHPIYFTPSDFMHLNGSAVHESSIFTLQECLAIYSTIWIKFHKNPDCANEVGFDLEQFTLRAFSWAYTTALTRNYDGSFYKDDVNKIMVPFWDLMNHENVGDLTTIHVAKERKGNKSFGIYDTMAKKALNAGQEVFMQYLYPLDAVEAFSTWGFVNLIYYPLKIQLEKSDPNYAAMEEQLNATSEYFDGGLSLFKPSLRKNLRYLEGHGKKATRLIMQIANGNENIEWTPKAVKKTWQFLIDQIDKCQTGYSTSIQKAKKALQDPNLDIQSALIFKEIIGEHKLLREVRSYILKFIDV